MKSVAVLGAGPAGAFAAERLAQGGLRTLLFDEKLAWEKPCGGGVTYKAYSQYPFLFENSTPKKIIHETVLTAPKAGAVSLPLRDPIVIYSRFDLNRMLIERAERAGAAIEKTRVLAVEPKGRGWSLRTRAGVAQADFCVIATGARNPLRDFGTRWSTDDTACALGYYVPSHRETIEVEFLHNLEGYIWVFPRCGHLSVGICGKGESSQALRQRLERYMAEKGIPLQGATFFGHVLPSLNMNSWTRNRVAGENWMAVGDAAGLVDPITGEGIYYAMRSAELASEALLTETVSDYATTLRRDFTEDLEFAAQIAKRVYTSNFLFGGVPARMVQFTRRSARFASLMQDLFAGTQSYLGLRGRLLRSLNGNMRKALMGVFLNIMPGEETA